MGGGCDGKNHLSGYRATGFIGSHIVRLLLEHGESKVVASNASGSTRNLEDVLDQVDIRRAKMDRVFPLTMLRSAP